MNCEAVLSQYILYKAKGRKETSNFFIALGKNDEVELTNAEMIVKYIIKIILETNLN